tara:strand:- start:1038 stop:1373 length:336 start_codon:yes stop_codon:yes gene_type:complete
MEFVKSLPNKGKNLLDTTFKRADNIHSASRKKINNFVSGVRTTGMNLHEFVGALSGRFGYNELRDMVLKYPKEFVRNTRGAIGTLKKIAHSKQARRRKSTRYRKRNRYSRL